MTSRNSAHSLIDLKAPGLPPEALEVICQLLSACSDEKLKALAVQLARNQTFALTDGSTLDESGDALFRSLPQHAFIPPRRELPSPLEYRQLPAVDVGEWFKPGGAFENAVPEFEYRPEQHQMAVAVAEAFNGLKHLVVEAGTGIGKTIAYLVPAVLWSVANKTPVVVSTNTKNLQEQIFTKDLPAIARVIRAPFKAALIKGRSNYLCLIRLGQLLSRREVELAENQLLPLARVCAWIYRTQTGDLSELDGLAGVSDRLASTPEECRGRKCRHYTRCFLQRARNLSINADIVITNHSVFFSEPDKPLALPRTAQVIFDEAHNLEEAATRKFEREVSSYAFNGTLRKLHVAVRRRESGLLHRMRELLLANNFLNTAEARDALFERLDAATRHVEQLRTSSRRFLKSLVTLLRKDESVMRLRPDVHSSYLWSEIVPFLQRAQDDLFALTADLEKIQEVCSGPEDAPVEAAAALPEPVADAIRELAALVSALHELADSLEFTTAIADHDWVYWVSVSHDFDGKPIGGLHAAPIEIAKFMAETVFAKKESVVLCSATMNVSHSPAFIAHRIGLDLIEPDRVMSLSVGSPFDYRRQCLAGVPLFLPNVAGSSPDAERDYTMAFADFTGKLAALSWGRMLVLFTSYRMMTTCAERLRPSLARQGIRLLVQGAGQSRERITSLFREDAPSVLMGTDSFWEGVDLIGEALSCLVIARLPFDAVNDPVVNARSERVAENGGDSFRDFALPNAIIKFRQGFGRLIRHKEDRGVVVVADQRIVTRNYGGSFRKNLPAELVQYADEATLLDAAARFLAPRSKALP
ncbi:MAG: ATP-dependent DNA helicase [Kiritimatiellia bacterium]|jgi:ATP-dependent DNA helicase DinG